jgi:hypothetical protein
MIMLDGNRDDNGFSPNNNTWATMNTSPAVKKSSPKVEEEISVEDIPF